MFNWRLKATNAIYLEDSNGQEGRPFKSRFLQAGLVKYDFGVCLLKKETIDKFVNTFVECPVIINHKDDIASDDVVGTIQKIWFSSDDGWFWCSGVITNDTAVELIEKGYNVSCQYRITEYADNDEGKLHNANPYDKEILDGVFEHLAIVENPRYEDAFIAVNAYIATNQEFNEEDHPRDREGKFTAKGKDSTSQQDITQTAEFKTWFKNSKVVNKDGKPLKVYHGSLNTNINAFDIDKAKSEKAIFFTDNRTIAQGYATYKNQVGKVYENYLSMQKPYRFNAKGKTYDSLYSQIQNIFSGLEESGYDGVIIENIVDKKYPTDPDIKSTIYAVLKPSQIKSTNDENSGSQKFNDKKEKIKPIQIKKNDIPKFENKKELSNWMKAQFEELGSVKIDDTGIDLKLSAGKANREAIKRRASKEENKAVVAKFKEIVSQAIKKDDRDADARHTKDQEIYYNKFQIGGEDYEVEIFVDKPYGTDKNSYYAGHSASKIKIAPRDTMNVSNDLTHYAKSANFIIPYLEIDFNPNAKINIATNDYTKVFDWIKNTKGEFMDTETKNVFSQLLEALKARNEAEEDKDKKEEKDEKATNEDVDKRKLIDEVGGILKGKVDEEVWRTIIGKLEKVAYDKSEAGTADNSKAKNEDEEEKKDDKKADEEAKNKCRNEEEEKLYEELKEKVEKEAENKKAKNALDEAVNLIYSAVAPEPKSTYVSQAEGLALGKQIYG